jgi:hypothetical protein
MYLPERLQAKKEDVKADIANKARCKDYSARPTTYGIPDIKKFGMTGLTLNIKSSKAIIWVKVAGVLVVEGECMAVVETKES